MWGLWSCETNFGVILMLSLACLQNGISLMWSCNPCTCHMHPEKCNSEQMFDYTSLLIR